MKTELIKCTKCARHNWHENTHCSWCHRKLPKVYKYEPLMNHIIVVVVVLSLCAMAYYGMSIGGE